ncbi:MAG: FAD-binding oxidoreductase [Aeromicrobium sp.]
MGTTAVDGFGGNLLEDGDDGYDDARSIFNAMIDRRPALIAQCESVSDVQAALAHAQANGLEIAIRSGGHSVAGASSVDGGLVIDMRRMNSVEVDPEARTATVAGGATWSDFDRATQEHGLATTGGRVSSTGVAGLTLGGGSGWLEREWGLACDNLLEVDIVAADGRVVTANEDENSELFWALHGGSGNFGIATRLVFQLHPLPATTLALLLWPSDAAPELARTYRALMEAGAPTQLGGGVAYLTGPPEPFVPEHLQGQRLTGVIGVYAGTEAELRDALAPIYAMNPQGGLTAEMPYADIQCAIDDPPGFRNYWSASHLASLPDEALDLFCGQGEEMIVPSPSQHLLIPWGGAVAEQATDWPMTHRGATWVTHPFGLWDDVGDDERGKAWVRRSVAEMKPYDIGSVYLNFVADAAEDQVRASYGEENYGRLSAVKSEYDPDNIFHLHHAIKPMAPA